MGPKKQTKKKIHRALLAPHKYTKSYADHNLDLGF